jgi:phage terminase large subunit
MTYLPTGQKILFRGLDDPLKITSITVKHGVLNYVWLEEAYEVENEDTFNKIEMSIRGKMPKGYFKSFILTFNPWSECWLKKRFFDNPDDDTLAMTTTYTCNEWLDESDIKQFEYMKQNNPRRYRIEGLGEWGISEGLIYVNTERRDIKLQDFIGKRDYYAFYGLDFGFTDPTAFVGGFINFELKEIYVLMELYEPGLTNQDIAERLKTMGIRHEVIKCDAAEPKSIEELRKAGINAKPASKGPDSVKFGIQKLQNFKIIYSPDCVNFEHEIKNYCWAKDRQGKQTDTPDHEYSHLMDGLRYATVDLKPSALNIPASNKAALLQPRYRR